VSKETDVSMKEYTGLSELAEYVESKAGPLGLKAFLPYRQEASQKVKQLPWPQARDEEWRRSPIDEFGLDEVSWGGFAPFNEHDAALLPPFLCRPANEIDLDACSDLGLEDFSAILKLHKGQDSSSWSFYMDPDRAAEGLEFGCFEIQEPSPSALRRLKDVYRRGVEKSDSRFQSWNLAAPDSAVYLYVPRNLQVQKELVLDLNFEGSEKAVNPLIVIYLEEGASLHLVERISGSGGLFVNSVMLLETGANSHFVHDVFQDTDEDTVLVGHNCSSVGKDSRIALYEAQLGGAWIKSRQKVDINGEGAEVSLDGLYFGTDEQHVDLRTVQNHNAPRAWSRALYKGVVRDLARAVYQGMIHVAHEAVRTDAYLTNKNLVLTDGARADSIPSLNILTDDVKCSHGSTTGRLEAEEVFYLQNRGFSYAEAQELLVIAYLDEVAMGMSELLRTAIQEKIHGRIKAVSKIEA